MPPHEPSYPDTIRLTFASHSVLVVEPLQDCLECLKRLSVLPQYCTISVFLRNAVLNFDTGPNS